MKNIVNCCPPPWTARPDMQCLLTSVRCPSCGHISKTKPDRPLVNWTTEHYNLHCRFCCRIQIHARHPSARCKQKICSLVRLCVRSHCQPSMPVVTPQVLSTVVNGVRRSESVVNDQRPLCLQHVPLVWLQKSNNRRARFFSQRYLLYHVIDFVQWIVGHRALFIPVFFFIRDSIDNPVAWKQGTEIN